MHKLLLAFLFLIADPAISATRWDYHPEVKRIRTELRHNDKPALAARTDRALDNMIQTSVIELRKRGHQAEAERIAREWKPFKGRVFRIVMAKGEVPEDYAPLFDWLSDWYHTMRATLGIQVCTMLHFDDIQVLNWGTPVVFDMTSVIGDAAPDAQRYELYFDPWCGVIAYWSVWGACTAATWGGGWFVICTPAAMLAEDVTVKFIAPAFAERAWEYFYTEGQL